MNINKKLIVSIICCLMLLISGTYAAMTFLTEKTDVTMKVDGDTISYEAGENISVNGIVPVYTMEEGVSKEVEIYKEDGKYTAGIDLYLNLKSWPKAFSSDSLRWSLYKNNIYLSSGGFSDTKEGNNIKLTSSTQKINLEENKDKYKLYIWIDAYSSSSVDMMNKSFTVSLYGQAIFNDENENIENIIEPNAPELADGMIPIRYNYITDEWQKADSSNIKNNWYDYENKMWANAVLVNGESREDYMNASVGTIVNEEDILAYFVWIPRYKYLLFNVDSEDISPVEIQIEFEKTTDLISQGDENGQYLSHPAFWWDNNSDGERASDGSEELAGIWFAKFEMGGTKVDPLIKPNIRSITKQPQYLFYQLNNSFKSTKYFTETGINQADVHVVKSIDWGAATYLSKSRYGINKNVTNNSATTTGRQGNYTYNDFYISGNKITNSKKPGTGILGSTTGNVYGIYDMGSGAYEYTMSFMYKKDSTAFCYGMESGFTSSDMPELKYYDVYEYNDNKSNYNNRILGDATGETRGWHYTNNGSASANTFIYNTDCVFRRGYNNQFYFIASNGYTGGGAGNTNGSRSVLVIPRQV